MKPFVVKLLEKLNPVAALENTNYIDCDSDEYCSNIRPGLMCGVFVHTSNDFAEESEMFKGTESYKMCTFKEVLQRKDSNGRITQCPKNGVTFYVDETNMKSKFEIKAYCSSVLKPKEHDTASFFNKLLSDP